jgi:hypothetical protein
MKIVGFLSHLREDFETITGFPASIGARPSLGADNPRWLLLDSRVVDLPMAYNPTFVILSSLKPLFFNSLKNEFRFSDNAEA